MLCVFQRRERITHYPTVYRFYHCLANMKRPLCFHLLLLICKLLDGVTTVSGFSYIDSLSSPQSKSKSLHDCSNGEKSIVTTNKSTDSYLESLMQPSFGAESNASTDNRRNTVVETPDDHYTKDHPGAGWAGYKDPMYGGYLDHLSSSENNDPTNNCVLESGKKPDYGDDIRWGAQVYLDNLD